MTITGERLALEGGAPVRSAPWPGWPVRDEAEEREVLEAVRSGRWGRAGGRLVRRAEETVASIQGARHCVLVASGTTALQVALRALGVGVGDEVVMPAYTFSATPAAAILLGAVPVFADVDPETYQLDAASAEAAISPRTRATVPVHVGGCPADLDAIGAVARRHGLPVLEDAAQAIGASWRGRRVGPIGDLGTFSFQSSKNLNCGEGGAIVTDDAELYERAWSLHNVGRPAATETGGGGYYQIDALGFNFRMTELQAALLLAQATRLAEQMIRREAAAAYLDGTLGAIDGIRPLRRDERVTEHAHHLYIVRYDEDAFGGRGRDEFLAALRAEGVPCGPGYQPPPHTPAIRSAVADLCRRLGRADDPLDRPTPVAARAGAREGVWLSQGMLLADEADLADVPRAVAKIRRAWGR